jgi:pimeloyl-ACP methyl ester carboxylesterase
MLALPADVRALSMDLRGFGDTETLPVDATRGVRDFSDDVASVIDELGLGSVHLVGWSMGGGVIMQLLLDRPELVASLVLQSTVSPYGFGGTALDGSLLATDAAGTGGGGVNPDFVARIAAGDRSDDPGSPRAVYRSSYVAPGFVSEHEDIWVESMLTTATGLDNYPGDSTTSENWPGFAPGGRGVVNSMAPTVFDTSAIVDVDPKPPILWIHGALDAIVGDASFFDLNQLGKAGIIPGWPGDDIAPAQPMIAQIRAVLGRYAAAGGSVTELELEDSGHSPHLERPAEFREALLALIDRRSPIER